MRNAKNRAENNRMSFSRQSHGCDVAGGPARSSMSMHSFPARTEGETEQHGYKTH